MFRVDAKTLAAALRPMLRIVHQRNCIPILGVARLHVDGDLLITSGTDLDVELQTEAIVDPLGEPGADLAIDPWRMMAVLRLLPRTETVELVRDGGDAVMSWNGGKVRFQGLPADDIPVFSWGFVVASATLGALARSALERVAPFISREETRYYLNGICLDQTALGGGVLVATDGHRLALVPGGDGLTALIQGLGGARPIVPTEAVHLWREMGARGDLVVSFARAEGAKEDGVQKIEVRCDGLRMRAKLIDVRFPDWTRVIPSREDLTPLHISRSSLMRASALAAAISVERSKEGVLIADNGRVQIQSKSTAGGEIAVDLGPTEVSGFSLGVNMAYLQHAVHATRGKLITLYVNSDVPLSAIGVQGSDALPGEEFVIMPLRGDTRRSSFSAPVTTGEDAQAEQVAA